MAKERDLRLDVLKAVAMCLVVLGHVILYAYNNDATRAPVPLAAAFSILSVLDVPLFVFVSGYLAPSAAGARWVGRRALQLLVPYAAWNVVIWAVTDRTNPLAWLLSAVVWLDQKSNPVWFLYTLFVLSALWALLGRNRTVLLTVAAACVFVPLERLPYFSMRYLVMLFPVFVAGRLVGERRFEPGAWSLAAAALLLLAKWSVPGANLLWWPPSWAASAVAGGGSGALWLSGGLTALRFALMLALIGTAMFLARHARRGAWLGALTLGIYAVHTLLLPQWVAGGGVARLVAGYALTMVAAIAVTLVLRRWRWGSFLFLGSGGLPWRAADRTGEGA
jgi:fucose 4-O-acetylase-like acetyltransferase